MSEKISCIFVIFNSFNCLNFNHVTLYVFNFKGTSIGSLINVDFSANTFDASTQDLFLKIKSFEENHSFLKLQSIKSQQQNQKSESSCSISILPANEIVNKQSVNQWSCQDVEKWLSLKNIHPYIKYNLNAFDGKLLYELYLIKKEDPEYFFETVGPVTSCYFSMVDLATFSYELRKLFNEI